MPTTTPDWFQRAQRMLAGELAGAFVLTLVFEAFGFPAAWGLLALLLFNLATAACFARAAHALGKSPVLFGLMAALGPPGAIFAWQRLRMACLYAAAAGPMAALPVVSEVDRFESIGGTDASSVSFTGGSVRYVLAFPVDAMPVLAGYAPTRGSADDHGEAALPLTWSQARELLERIRLVIDAETRGATVFARMVAIAARDGRAGDA